MTPRPSFLMRARHALAWVLAGPQSERLKKAKSRVRLAMLGFGALYGVIAVSLVLYVVRYDRSAQSGVRSAEAVSSTRPDILDRNGEVLATDVRAISLYAEPKKLAASFDVDEATELLTAVLPDLDQREVRERLRSGKGFVWLRREITPTQRDQIHRLGIPGVGFLREAKRTYPNGATLSHVLGMVNVDNQGLGGIERYIDNQGLAELHRAGFVTDRNQAAVQLSIDLRVQHVLRDELVQAHQKFRAKAAAGVIVDVNTGEILALASIPDYDPNRPSTAAGFDRANRITTGVYEMGSVMKSLTTAMALDSGRFTINSTLDARFPMAVGRHQVKDFHAQRRVLTLPEVFTYSSNIGTSRMALTLGGEHQRSFLRRLGQFDRVVTEIGPSTAPLVPRRWADITAATVSFGHGISVAPLQAVMGTAALVNGGRLIQPTFLRRTPDEANAIARQVIRPETSQAMRFLMRLNSERGSGRRAEVDGFYVGGKTGTSEKVIGGRYSKDKQLNSFMAIFPADQPRYLLLVMLDEPRGIPETHGLATAGFNAAPTAGRVIARSAPLLGLQPRFDMPPAMQAIQAGYRMPGR
ncbi:peptidoglycan D,D-transpeptidase FtsI family protein [Phreatobacter cathodiphilus]|uniref:Penicillin-binding protein n=1 Tax=Phreatobacter cathodiphilus TaxID=1868589 RepID=A0A2S0N6A4_9HYPH|nr:penicillin-binding protein 2 [Phreatobacter cathodiphilus]AVO43682.1 penicillin-binding protein [Phreatobacter cathodiphilus]